MTDDVALLPLPEPAFTGMSIPYYNADQVRDCVAHAAAAKDAEIEALRAASCGDACAHIAIERDMLQARAERLARGKGVQP